MTEDGAEQMVGQWWADQSKSELNWYHSWFWPLANVDRNHYDNDDEGTLYDFQRWGSPSKRLASGKGRRYYRIFLIFIVISSPRSWTWSSSSSFPSSSWSSSSASSWLWHCDHPDLWRSCDEGDKNFGSGDNWLNSQKLDWELFGGWDIYPS